MFGLGMTEMIVIGVIALLVVGPKDLPRLFKGIAGFMRQLRKLTREFQGVVNDMIRESDLDDLRKEAQDLRSNIDPTQDLRDAMRETENESRYCCSVLAASSVVVERSRRRAKCL